VPAAPTIDLHHLLRTSTRANVAGLVVALAAMAPSWGWRVGRLAVTALHETGHALAVLIAGGRVRAVHLRADTSGLTWHQGLSTRRARALTAAAGYPAPGLTGLVGAAVVGAGHPTLWLGALAVTGAAEIVLWVRNPFGLLTTLAAVGGLCALLALAPRTAIDVAGAATAWYLAIGGLRACLEARRERGASDAEELARCTRLPAALCRLGFVAVAAASLAAGTVLLLHLPT
jgi:hypothetical protein